MAGAYEAREYLARYLDKQYWRKDPAIAEAQARINEQQCVFIRVDISRLDADLRAAIYPNVSDRVVICGRKKLPTIGLSVIRRNPHGPFAAEAISRLTEVADLLMCLLAKHADIILHRPNLALALTSLPEVERCIVASETLPRRETEVCARILYGISSIGIALDLGISEESIKTYRKRAYERLRIGSERELLKWYLALWGSFQRGAYRADSTIPIDRAPSSISR